jgi:hypothetical protein
VHARRLAVALLSCALIGVTGCAKPVKDSSGGFKGEQRLVANTVEDLQEAGRKRDASRICTDLLASAVVTRIERAGTQKCTAAVKDSLDDADAFELTVKRVSVNGSKATAVVESDTGKDDKRTDTMALVKEGTPGRWKVASLGE